MRCVGNKLVRLWLVATLSLAVGLVACSTSWIGEAEQIAAALVPAAANIVTLVAALQGKSVSTADMQLIQNAGVQAGADFQLIQSLITAYQKADSGAQAGILQQIQDAILSAQANLQGLLPALHIKDTATQTKITAVVGILLSEVESLAAIVPMIKAGTGELATAQIEHPKLPLPAAEFVASYNATLTAKTGNADLDRATAAMEIHSHGKFARWASAGMLK